MAAAARNNEKSLKEAINKIAAAKAAKAAEEEKEREALAAQPPTPPIAEAQPPTPPIAEAQPPPTAKEATSTEATSTEATSTEATSTELNIDPEYINAFKRESYPLKENQLTTKLSNESVNEALNELLQINPDQPELTILSNMDVIMSKFFPDAVFNKFKKEKDFEDCINAYSEN